MPFKISRLVDIYANFRIETDNRYADEAEHFIHPGSILMDSCQ